MTQGDGYKEEEIIINREWVGRKEAQARRMPIQKPGRSNQSYATPPEFIRAVKKRFGIGNFDIDLAADANNKQAPRFYGIETDALTQPWKIASGWNWLNPPFGKIEPWVSRAFQQSKDFKAKTLVLVPASVGSNWWRNHVHGKCQVILLNGRITFLPETKPFPKDCCLLRYGLRGVDYIGEPWYDLWNWREDCK